MSTWRQLLTHELKQNFETFDDLIKIAIPPGHLDLEFDSSYGAPEGCPFTAWSENFVYFPIQYDGAEWVGSAPRNPCDMTTEHQGGG